MNSLVLLKNEGYTQTPWKNGLGLSYQIDLKPDDSGQTPFIFRFSQAKVSADNPFSIYPGYQRLLVVTEGNGLILNQKTLLPLTVFSFSGDEDIFCRLINGPCLDLGLIFDPKKISAQMDVFNQVSTYPDISFNSNSHSSYLFLVSGELKIENKSILPGDTLKIVNQPKLQLATQKTSTYIVIKINRISDF